MMLAVSSDTSIFFGGSIAAATIAGMIALFAPCCVSVMLPAYFAASFQNRRLLIDGRLSTYGRPSERRLRQDLIAAQGTSDASKTQDAQSH